jgi:Tol biopolymer transport system component
MVVIATFTLFGCGRDLEPTTSPIAGPPVSLGVSPTTLSLAVGRFGTITARAVDAAGRPARVSVAWSSADPAVATVGQSDGTVVAVSPGATTVTAAAGTLTATTTVSVRPPDPPVAVSISPATLSIITGGTQRLAAYATDSTGQTVNVSLQWLSANPAVATIGSADGVVTGVSVGVTTVTVTAGTLTATATVSVFELAGFFAFTRTTSSAAGNFASDVLLSSNSDRTLRSLPRPPQFASIAAPAWSPDASTLVVEVVREFSGPPRFEWLEYTSDLYIFDATEPAVSPWRALTTNGFSSSPSWSPDGRRIAYLEQEALFSTNHIALIDPSGGTPTRLTLATGSYGRPRWSPDGTRLAFSGFPNGSAVSQIFVINADGTGLTTITPNTTSDADPAWSPDGARLAFVRFRIEGPGTYYYEVAVSDVTGRNVRILTSSSDYASAPTWSPDGRQIMFSFAGAIHVMNADGSGLTRITAPAADSWDSAPTWRQ